MSAIVQFRSPSSVISVSLRYCKPHCSVNVVLRIARRLTAVSLSSMSSNSVLY